MAGPTDGLATAVELALAQQPEEPEQLDLLGLPRPADGRPAPRGRGRPPGARNKRTEAWADRLTGRYGSVLEVLVQIATTSVEDLTRGLGCKPVEALAEKRQAAIAALPYLHQRQPVAVDVSSRQMVQLVVEASPDVAEMVNSDAGEGVIIDLTPVDVAEEGQ